MKILQFLCRKSFLGLCLALPIAGLIGCHAMTGTVSHEPTAHISFHGASDGDMATIDDGAPVRLHAGDDNNPVATLPGKHVVRVSRSGAMVVDQEILVSDLQTLEIRIP